MLTGGLMSGILLGSLIAAFIKRHYTHLEIAEYAWRIPFLMGGLFGLVSAFLRRWLHETPVFIEMAQRKSLAAGAPLKTVLRNHRGAVLAPMLLTWTLTARIVVVILMTPTLLQNRFQIDVATAMHANSLATLFLTIGCIAAGSIANRYGAGRTIFFGCLLFWCFIFFAAAASGKQSRLVAAAFRGHKPFRRYDRGDPCRNGRCFPAGHSFLHDFLLVQCLISAVRLLDPNSRVANAQD